MVKRKTKLLMFSFLTIIITTSFFIIPIGQISANAGVNTEFSTTTIENYYENESEKVTIEPLLYCRVCFLHGVVCASCANPVARLVSISSHNNNRQIAVGGTLQLTGHVQPSHMHVDFLWSSSNTNVATISAGGVVRGISLGQAVITIQICGTNLTSTITITVAEFCGSAPNTITIHNANNIMIGTNATTQLSVAVQPLNSNNRVTWHSYNPGIATVSEAGVVRGVSVGTARIRVRSAVNPNITNFVDVQVVSLPTSLSISGQGNTQMNIGDTRQLSVLALPATAGNSVTWHSSNHNVVSVTATGLLTAVSMRTAVITARSTLNTNIYTSITIRVFPVNSHNFRVQPAGFIIDPNQAIVTTWQQNMPDLITRAHGHIIGNTEIHIGTARALGNFPNGQLTVFLVSVRTSGRTTIFEGRNYTGVFRYVGISATLPSNVTLHHTTPTVPPPSDTSYSLGISGSSIGGSISFPVNALTITNNMDRSVGKVSTGITLNTPFITNLNTWFDWGNRDQWHSFAVWVYHINEFTLTLNITVDYKLGDILPIHSIPILVRPPFTPTTFRQQTSLNVHSFTGIMHFLG
ncbi:MAG: Ig-like domain-containing protein [Firmicutes bacterium]|nr:Ig-like domain-containing protein [Bacillota bacterium]